MAKGGSLVDDAALRLAVRPETAEAPLPRTRITQPMRIPMRDLAVGVFVLLAAIWVGDQWLRATTARSVPWPLADRTLEFVCAAYRPSSDGHLPRSARALDHHRFRPAFQH